MRYLKIISRFGQVLYLPKPSPPILFDVIHPGDRVTINVANIYMDISVERGKAGEVINRITESLRNVEFDTEINV